MDQPTPDTTPDTLTQRVQAYLESIAPDAYDRIPEKVDAYALMYELNTALKAAEADLKQKTAELRGAEGMIVSAREALAESESDNATLRGLLTEYKMVADAAEQAEMRYHADCVAAEADRQRLRDLIAAFLTKWPDAEKGINSAIVMASVHGAPYTGPSLQVEVEAFKAALRAGQEP
jgi:hypothetical protein